MLMIIKSVTDIKINLVYESIINSTMIYLKLDQSKRKEVQKNYMDYNKGSYDQIQEVLETQENSLQTDNGLSLNHSYQTDENKTIFYYEHARFYLEENYDFDDDAIDKIIKSAISAMNSDINALESALENNDISSVNHAAHSLKGALYNLGLIDLAKEAHEIQLFTSL